MRLRIARSAERDLEHLSPQDRARVQRALDQFELTGKAELRKLKGGLGYRLRVGELRVLFTYLDNDSLLVAAIRPRGSAYKP